MLAPIESRGLQQQLIPRLHTCLVSVSSKLSTKDDGPTSPDEMGKTCEVRMCELGMVLFLGTLLIIVNCGSLRESAGRNISPAGK
ncbi:hypothetical protein K505DRAFT_328433 [Melanomma pulvis-pyrius CBS 109.77]|uniref:Uncharacterized protein n=1 Tax=Melanomma pulvis-pyrius CBS 109.77 TaxID=1314802 RepID=A0A6A6WYJ8_9PLEO|nr:hypothetical protein K505DRAFT_328433 [Melanomma pulvis-pyrius CBS 109.77]